MCSSISTTITSFAFTFRLRQLLHRNHLQIERMYIGILITGISGLKTNLFLQDKLCQKYHFYVESNLSKQRGQVLACMRRTFARGQKHRRNLVQLLETS